MVNNSDTTGSGKDENELDDPVKWASGVKREAQRRLAAKHKDDQNDEVESSGA